MTPTQKRFFEIPILLLIIWCVQALEISLLQLPFQHGAVQTVPVLIIYFALTRSWTRLGILALAFSVIGSFTVGYAPGIFMAVQIWTALVTKIIVSEFALEGRRPFVFLVMGSHIFSKILTWVLLTWRSQGMPLPHTIEAAFISVFATALIAWFIFPFCIGWDEYFDHPIHESRELNPEVLR